jgi:hypothetical protein
LGPKFHNEELHNLYSSCTSKTDQIKKNEVGGTCCKHGRGEKCTRFWWELQEKRPFEKMKSRWQDGFKFQTVWGSGGDGEMSFGSGQEPVVGSYEHGNEL